MSPLATAEVIEAMAALRRRIDDAGGEHVRVVAVTKGFGADALVAAGAAGADACGESYAQELVAKAEALGLLAGGPAADRAPWAAGGSIPPVHFIGRLQRRKVRQVAPHVALWQSVDRLELGAEIARRAPGAHVLVQVNCSGEDHKGGCSLADAPELVDQLHQLGLTVDGLMGMGPMGPPEDARPGFEALVAMAERLGLPERSIGMSGDLEVAVAAGATMVRVGTDLFGARPGLAGGSGGGP